MNVVRSEISNYLDESIFSLDYPYVPCTKNLGKRNTEK